MALTSEMAPALREPGLYPGDPRADSEQSEFLLPAEPRLRLKGEQLESQEKAGGRLPGGGNIWEEEASTLSEKDSQCGKFSRHRKCVQKMQEGHRHDKYYCKGRAGQLGRGSYFQAQRSSQESRTDGSWAVHGLWGLAGVGAGQTGAGPYSPSSGPAWIQSPVLGPWF